LSVCLQVNVSNEATKSGVSLDEAPRLAQEIAHLPRLRLRGLMAVPAATDDFTAQRLPFRRLRELYEQLRADGLPLDTLSMGMSHDLEAAVAEGTTLLRVGSAIFGERNHR
jgi:pyridoxal phosphate enzyme (YggS family)